MDARYSIPYPVPLLGEEYSSLNNPVLLASLDFLTHVRLTGEPADSPDIPVTSAPLRHALTRILKDNGACHRLALVSDTTDQTENDFLATAAIIHAYRLHESPGILMPALSLPDDRSFLTMARAMNAVSGGFIVVRRGEGAISLESRLDAAFHLNLRKTKSRVRAKLESFALRHPDLAQPTWHLLGHLVLEGGKRVRESDLDGLGEVMTMEASISHALCLVEAKDLVQECMQGRRYATKPIRSEIMTGELILAPRETLPLSRFNRLCLFQEGMVEDDKG